MKYLTPLDEHFGITAEKRAEKDRDWEKEKAISRRKYVQHGSLQRSNLQRIFTNLSGIDPIACMSKGKNQEYLRCVMMDEKIEFIIKFSKEADCYRENNRGEYIKGKYETVSEKEALQIAQAIIDYKETIYAFQGDDIYRSLCDKQTKSWTDFQTRLES